MYPFNPQSAVSVFHSSLRNTIITNGVALTLFGMSIKNISNFWKNLLTLVAYMFVLISVFISYNASKHLKMVLDLLKNDKELQHNYKIFLPEWEKWYQLGLVFTFVILLIGTVILISKSIIPFNI
jgi:hypothetical protein